MSLNNHSMDNAFLNPCHHAGQKFSVVESWLKDQKQTAYTHVLRVFRGVLFRVTILAEWFRHFNGLAVGETAAPACFLRENAEGEGMPLLLSL